MKNNVRRLLNTLYDELRFNVKLIDKYDENYRIAISIGDINTAEVYNMWSLRLVEDNQRLITAINEIEKRVS